MKSNITQVTKESNGAPAFEQNNHIQRNFDSERTRPADCAFLEKTNKSDDNALM